VRVAGLLAGLCGIVTVASPPPAAEAQPPAGQRCDLPATASVPGRPWAQRRLDFERVWPLTRGAGVVVGVVDTGVQGSHPQLRGGVLTGIDVLNGGTADTDCVGHGTLVAGLLAARPVPGTEFAGVAPAATVLPVRVSNSAQGTAAPLAAGIQRAVDAGAKVINVSLVVGESTEALRSAVNHAIAHDVVVVAATGNEFESGDPVRYPAAYPGVLAVGAVGVTGARAGFSDTASGVSVVAPGDDIVGPGAGGPGLVAGGQGTSYAAAFVTGVAALVRAYRPELTAAQVVDRIERTADHPPAVSLPDAALGWGTVNPYTAVTAALPGPPEPAAPPRPGPALRLAHPSGSHPAGPERAWWSALAVLVVTTAVAGAAALVPAARRRRWHPGRRC
jgi:type VII secretion-associated serine protease mycosin